MKHSQTNPALYENISHITDSAPYSIHYTQVPADSESALYLHWHNEMEFLLLTDGTVEFHIEDKCFTVHRGECIYIPPKLLHYACNVGSTPVSFYAFVLSPDFIVSSFETQLYNTYILPIMHNSLPLALTLTPGIHWQRELLGHLNHILTATAATPLYIRGLSLLIWEQFYTNHIAPLSTKKALPSLAKQLSTAIAYLHTNYQRSITLNELAASVHLSEGEFCRSFKRLTGLTPFRYLVRYRILQSCNELQFTNQKITDIALSNGFNNISYYNRAFMKLMNMTPSEYRKTQEQVNKTTASKLSV